MTPTTVTEFSAQAQAYLALARAAQFEANKFLQLSEMANETDPTAPNITAARNKMQEGIDWATKAAAAQQAALNASEED